jgi:hypothetical protein
MSDLIDIDKLPDFHRLINGYLRVDEADTLDEAIEIYLAYTENLEVRRTIEQITQLLDKGTNERQLYTYTVIARY